MALVFHPSEQISVPLPSRECEVFVYKIPPSISEQELVSMFEKYGDIFKLRLIRQGSNGNSYAFVRFTEKCAVAVAVLRWNGYEIRKGQRISVCRSIENKSLVLCSIPRYLSSRDIYFLIRLYTAGLEEVNAHAPRDNRGVNSGIAVLRYETHTSASIAKKILNSIRNFLWDRPVYIEWYTPGLQWDHYEPYATSGSGVGSHAVYTQAATRTQANPWAVSGYQDFLSETVVVRGFSEIYGHRRNIY